jgi:hypothetical protein
LGCLGRLDHSLEAALVIQAEADMSTERIGLAIIVLVAAMGIAAYIVRVLSGRGQTILLFTLLLVLGVVAFVIQMRGG